MFKRFTDRSRRVVVLAQEEARMLGHGQIGTEHLLLGLLHEQSGAASRVLRSAGVTLEAARARVAEATGTAGPAPTGHIPFTPQAKRTLELSLRQALELGHQSIGPEHVLLGLIREADSAGARLLERLGCSLPALRRQVNVAASAESPEPAGQSVHWQPAQGSVREGRVPPQTVIGFRLALVPISRRLAGIEQHLGIAADDEPAAGFRGLLDSIGRRLANIERHLGVDRDDAEGRPAEAGQPGDAAPAGPTEPAGADLPGEAGKPGEPPGGR